MPVINGVYLKDFPALPSSVADANIIPIAISGNQIAYRTTVAGIVTDARVTSKLLTGLSVTGSTILATDTILQAFGKVQNQLNGKVTSVGLTMPAAFNVANSPITSAGTLAVTAAGVASQYIRGDGALADFPTSTGGGSSVSYYLNGSVSQGTIGGNAYKEMNKTPVIGTGTDFTINANGYIAQFITDANDPASLLIPAGNWNVEMYFSASSNGGTPSFYVEVYKYDGSTFTLLGSSSATPEGITNGTAIDIYYTSVGIPETVLTITDRLAIRVYVTHSGRTITLHTEDNHLSEIVTTFSNGLTTLNGLTKQAQYFAVGSTGTDFAIVSSVDTHTFNIPDASATARGLINIGSQTIGGDKILTSASSNPTLSLRNTGAGRKFEIKDSGGGNILYVDYIGQTYILGNLTIGGGNTFDMGQTMLATGASYFASSLSVTRTLSTNSYNIAFRTGATQVTATPNWYAGNFTGNNDFEISSYNGSSVQTTFKINSTTNLVTLLGGISATTANFTGQLTLGSTITNGTYTYTLPGATGTLALTSALSGYLPLTGGTLSTTNTTETLRISNGGTGYGLYVQSDSYFQGDVKFQAVANSLLKTVSNVLTAAVAGTDYVIPSALSSYLPLSGGTLTGALSGTSATFSDNVTLSAAATNKYIQYTNNNGSTLITNALNNNSYITGALSGEALILSGTVGKGLRIGNTADNVSYLSFTSTGAATFSSRVNLNGATDDGSTALNLLGSIRTDGTSNAVNFRNGFTAVIRNPNNNTRDLQIEGDGVTAIFKGDGKVGIGTTSPSSKLHVFSANGTTYASTAQLRVDGGGVNNNYAQIIFSDSALSDGKISYYPAAAAADRFFSISARTTESDFIIKGNGNVGIGTTSPASIGTGYTTVDIRGANGSGIVMGTTSASYGYVYADATALIMQSAASTPILFFPGGTERMRITSAGVVTINAIGTGTVQATAGVLSVISDSKAKDKTGLFEGSALNAINKIEKPQYWNYNAKSELGESTYSVKQFGLFADDIHEVLGEEFAPTQTKSFYDEKTKETKVEPILIDGSPSYSMSDRALLSLAIQAIQELKAEIDLLKGEPIIPTDNNLE